MKVLLINSYNKSFKPVFPLGLSRIVSSIKEKHEVEVFDLNIELKSRENLKLTLEDFNPDVVGISLRNIDSVDFRGKEYFYPDFVRLLKLIRMTKSNAVIIVGGSGFSLFAEEIMRDRDEIDIGVFLEAEESFPELLDNIDSPQNVKGVFFRRDDSVQFSGKPKLVDLENLPRPAYEYFDLNKYISRLVGIGIETKRGCCFNCAYCPYPFLNGQNLRMRAVSDVVDEIELLVSKYNISKFDFVDSVFNVPLKHGMDICNEIISRDLKIRWSCWSNIKTFTEEYARLAIDAGCVAFPFSTDAFSDESLMLLHKNYLMKDILKTVEIAKKIDNINIGHSFFLNPPGSSTKTIFEMIWFLLKTKWVLGKKMRKIFMINRIRVEPHTKMQEIATREGLVKPGSSLLKPIYYRQQCTHLIECLYNAIILPLNLLIKIRRLARRAQLALRG